MGAYDPIVIAVCGTVSLLALGAVYIVAWRKRRQDERAATVVEPEPAVVLTEDDHIALWTEELWPGAGTYAARVDELSWLDHPGARP